MKRLLLVFLGIVSVSLVLCLIHYWILGSSGWQVTQAAFSFAINVGYTLTLVVVMALVILDNGNPTKTVSWLLTLVFLPILGILLYLFFGGNLRKHKFFSCHQLSGEEEVKSLSSLQLSTMAENPSIDQPLRTKSKIMKLALSNYSAPLTYNNSLKILNNGKETYAALLKALSEATHSIHMEYYIFEEGAILDRIKEILMVKAQSGVQVRFVYDALGSWKLRKKTIRALKRAGVQVKSFLPLKISVLANKINYRNHRKIVVIDGKIGFIGGINISDVYLGQDHNENFWRDMHLSIEGEAVLYLQRVFLQDWYYTSGQNLNPEEFFSDPQTIGSSLVQVIASGPDSDWSNIQQTFFTAINSATDYVYITTPYLILSENMKSALITAALAGVDVKLIIPNKGDSIFVNWSSKSYLEDLLQAGVKVYGYQRGFIHSKMLIVDDGFVTLGSSNLDIRSFDQNFEINALIYDLDLSKQAKHYFMSDLKDSRQIHPREFYKRPWVDKLLHSLSRLLSPLF